MKGNRMAMTVGVVAGAAALVGVVAYFATKKSSTTPSPSPSPGPVNWQAMNPAQTLSPGEYRVSAPGSWPATGLNTTTAVISEFYGAQEAVLPADWGTMPGAAADAAAAGISGDDDGRVRIDINLTAPLQLQDTQGVLVWRAS